MDLEKEGSRVGLGLNTDETKVPSLIGSINFPILVALFLLMVITNSMLLLTYLLILTTDSAIAFTVLSIIWKCNYLNTSIKLRLFNADYAIQ